MRHFIQMRSQRIGLVNTPRSFYLSRLKRCIYNFFFIFTFVFIFNAYSSASTVKVEVVHSQDNYHAGDTYPVLFHIKVATPWYIHGPRDEGQGLIPTRFSVNDSENIKIEQIRFPDPERKKFEYTSDAIEVYSGEIFIHASIVVDQKVPVQEHVLEANLFYQACSSKICLPPKNISINVKIPVVSRETPVTKLNQDKFISSKDTKDIAIGGFLANPLGSGFLFTLLAIFLGGLALNLTPCIYPLIPITVSYFGGKSETIKGHTLLHGAFYLSGLAITNSALGVSAAFSGRMLGTALQNPAVLIFLASIMTILAFSFFGFWEIRVPQFLNRIAAKNYRGYFGTFFMGLTLGILAAPCIGPFILGLLTHVGQKGDPLLGFLYFFVLSIGMGLPLCILAIFSGILDRLPMSGDWMIWIKKVMGWVLIGMAIYIIKSLIPTPFLRTLLYSAVFIAAGIHLGFFDKTGQGFKKFLYAKSVLCVMLIVYGLLSLSALFQKDRGVVWEPYSPEGIVQAIFENKPVIIDFYADWCLPCKELDKKVFHKPEVVQLSKKFIMLRLDLTRRHPMQEEIMRQYNLKGVPAVLFLDREGNELRELRVEYAINKMEFLNKMNKLLAKTSEE